MLLSFSLYESCNTPPVGAAIAMENTGLFGCCSGGVDHSVITPNSIRKVASLMHTLGILLLSSWERCLALSTQIAALQLSG